MQAVLVYMFVGVDVPGIVWLGSAPQPHGADVMASKEMAGRVATGNPGATGAVISCEYSEFPFVIQL